MQLYIHVPFCRQKCHYCGFYSIPMGERFKDPPARGLEIADYSKINLFSAHAGARKKNTNAINLFSAPVKLEQLLSNSTQTSTVRSLADILNDGQIPSQNFIPSATTGPSLADAFLSVDEANALRQQMGHSPLVDIEQPAIITSMNPSLTAYLQPSLPLTKNYHDTEPFNKFSPYELWKKHVHAEITLLAKYYDDMPITSIFFGGGTPSLIPIKDMESIFNAILKNFSVLRTAEITLEANPESVTREKAKAYMQMGFNRVSLGVQSLQNENLLLMGRVHTAQNTMHAFNALREAHCNNINLDFIWGLPNQKIRSWLQDIREAIELDPEHLSCYGLSIEKNSPFDVMQQEGFLNLPDDKLQANMYKECVVRLESAGYMQYEISNFAQIGYQCQHNCGYWENKDFLGIGPAASGTFENYRRTHSPNVEEWAQDVANGALEADLRHDTCKNAHFQSEHLSMQEQICELIMLRLRTVTGLPLTAYYELCNRSFLDDHHALLQLLQKHQLLRIKNQHVYLTPNGMLVSTSILERFFQCQKELAKSIDSSTQY